MEKLWVALESRLPIRSFIKNHLFNYRVPASLNIWYVFGLLALIFLFNQYLSGIWLAMFYIPGTHQAFHSIQSIMHDIPAGWFIRYLHTTGASFLFVVLYLHIVRGFLYGSYHKPRELVWGVGIFLWFILLAQAFLGYVLPWGQMSYWGAEVVTSSLNGLPWMGSILLNWVRGGAEVGGALLQRFYALHVIALPLLLLYIIKLHIVAIRYVGSSSPNEGSKQEKTIPFFPHHLAKESFPVAIFITIFFAILFFKPDLWGLFIESDNAIPANPLYTPSPIHPPWYLTAYFAILRSVPNLSFGLLLTFMALIFWFFLPILDKSNQRVLRHKSKIFRIMVYLFWINYLLLSVLGWFELNDLILWISRFATIFYFLFFMLMPWYSQLRSEPC
jgi:ubiquinol-cytochrome c reductase cytochrome b subunit